MAETRALFGTNVKAGAAEFFAAAQDAFFAQAKAGPVRRREYEIAGLDCRTEIAGEPMASRLSRALAHLPAPKMFKTGLTIRAWNGAIVQPLWSQDEYGPRGEVIGFNTERFSTVFDHGAGALSMLDREGGVALFWTRDAANLPSYETGAPFRTIFGWWMEQNERVLIHGGAVAAGKRGGAILIGPGGSGKSTTALLCLQGGLGYLADDYCVIAPGDPPRVFSLYNTAKVARTWLPRIPQSEKLRGATSEMHDDKHLLFLNELCPDQLVHSTTGRVLLLPRVSGEANTEMSMATPGEALRALAPSTIFQNALPGATTFRQLSKLVRHIPVRRLSLGSELDQVATEVENCLKHI